MSELRDESGVLSMETERIEITSNLPRTDKAWRYTDHHGHEHYWQDGYPTLVEVVEATGTVASDAYVATYSDENEDDDWDEYDEYDDEDEYTASHLECPQCGETVTPGTRGPSGFREFVPGRRSYYLDGKPISEERWREIYAARRSSDQSGVPNPPDERAPSGLENDGA